MLRTHTTISIEIVDQSSTRIPPHPDCKNANDVCDNDNDNDNAFIPKVLQGETCDQYNTYSIVCLKSEQDE